MTPSSALPILARSSRSIWQVIVMCVIFSIGTISDDKNLREPPVLGTPPSILEIKDFTERKKERSELTHKSVNLYWTDE